MIDVGLIGFGLAGRAFHAPVIHAVPGLRLAAILQRRGDATAELYPVARVVRSVEEMLSISKIQLVVIATPNDTHYPIARQCLAAGRDGVGGKPTTPTLEQTLDLVKFWQKKAPPANIFQNPRVEGAFYHAQQMVSMRPRRRLCS